MQTTNHIADQSARRPRTLQQAFLASVAPRVLLAEDNADMREMLEGALRRDGYRVKSVADGNALYAALNARDPYLCTRELIISDVRMPGRSGLEVLEHLRHRDWATPVILMSAFADPETHRQAERLGSVVLDKPFALEQLRAVARDLQSSLPP